MKKLLTRGMVVLAALLILSACGAELEGEYLSDYEFVGTGCTYYTPAGEAVEWKFDKYTMTQTVYDDDLRLDSAYTFTRNYESNKNRRTITLDTGKGSFTFLDGTVYDGSPISYKRGTLISGDPDITFTYKGNSLPFKYGTYFPEIHKQALFKQKLLGLWQKGVTTIEFKENGKLEIKNHNHSEYDDYSSYSIRGLPSDSDNLNKVNKCEVRMAGSTLLLTIKGNTLDTNDATFGSGYIKQY